MIKQDYIIRIIQEIISTIVNAIIKKKRLDNNEMEEYDICRVTVTHIQFKEKFL